jgi:hypothetical protein
VNVLATVSGAALLIYRYHWLGQKFWDVVGSGGLKSDDDDGEKSGRGIFMSSNRRRRELSDWRPRPIEHFLL